MERRAERIDEIGRRLYEMGRGNFITNKTNATNNQGGIRELTRFRLELGESGCRWLGVVLAVSVCLGCAALLCVGQVVVAQTNPAYQATFCVGAVTMGRTQVGVWWQALFMSRLMTAAVSPYALCANIPWPPLFPPAGEIAFPP